MVKIFGCFKYGKDSVFAFSGYLFHVFCLGERVMYNGVIISNLNLINGI